MNGQSKLRLVIGAVAIIIAVVISAVTITAGNVRGLRISDREQIIMIGELKTQTQVIENELINIRKELESHGIELKEIKDILYKMNGSEEETRKQ